MEPVPGLNLSQPKFDLLDAAGRARLSARVHAGWLRRHAGGVDSPWSNQAALTTNV